MSPYVPSAKGVDIRKVQPVASIRPRSVHARVC
jgi:hypothetical protein